MTEGRQRSAAAAIFRSRGKPRQMKDDLRMLETPSGIRFGLLGEKPSLPAPTLIVAGSDLESSLTDPAINGVGLSLKEKGILCIALDVPCHGAAQRKGERFGLDGWRDRLEQNENFVAAFTEDVSSVLDHLIEAGHCDPSRIAMAGTSRGGFMGFHAMAVDERIRWGAAFAPLVELPVLEELRGLEDHELTRRLALTGIAGKFAGRPIWICIGNNDERVGVDRVIAFTRKVVGSSLGQSKPAAIEIHVMPSEGHYTHDTAHEEAAIWLSDKLGQAQAGG